MCGIAGLIGHGALIEHVTAMTSAIQYRGPDDSGIWVNEAAGVSFGHRRLSIVDLSAAGKQPMSSQCGRYVVSFNGEIYNYRELRATLEREDATLATRWKGTSDTEVMLAAFTAWGIRRTLKVIGGMFAIAVWDAKERAVYLARDRMGEKPLYYGEVDGCFAFASELKALTAIARSTLAIDRAALGSLMKYGYVGAPLSIYQGIYKLPPACVLKIRVHGQGHYTIESPEPYWSLRTGETEALRASLASCEGEELERQLHDLLLASVSREMVADVDVGAFLSGGIDSSLVVALMKATATGPVRTFTIGFEDPAFNEADYAKAVAQHLGTSHTELYLSPRDAYELVPRLGEIYDEPLGDSSQIPTVLVSRLTRQHVTVALSGDGGDELFGGYPRYQFGPRVWGRINSMPKVARCALAHALRILAPKDWDSLLRFVRSRSQDVNGHRLHRLAHLMLSAEFGEFYRGLVAQWQHPADVVRAGPPLPDTPDYREAHLLDRMRAFDLDRYLPDDILVKVDRAAMHVSLETRAPLLDHSVVEFAWALPQQALVRNGTGKWILRRVLERYVPPSLFERPKRGFGIPLGAWLRKELRPWAEELLDERRLREDGFLDPVPIRRMWEEHTSGKFDRQAYLWNVLSFQSWVQAQGSSLPHSSRLAS